MYGLEDKGMGSLTLDGRTMLAAAGVSNPNAVARANYLQTQDGWYLDLPLTGERANTNPTLNFGVLSFTSNIPDDEPCNIYGGTSWLNYVDYRDGGGVSLSTGATSATRELLGSFIATRITVLVTAQGNAVAVGVKSGVPGGAPGSGAPANLAFDKTLPKAGTTGRVMWRQLINK